MSEFASKFRPGLPPVLRKFASRRAVFAIEFAIVAPVFLLLLFVVFEVSYDLFMQEVLNNTLQYTAREIQIGNTQGGASATFVRQNFCPADGGLLNCNSVYLRIQALDFAPGSCSNLSNSSTGDVYDATSGQLPVTNGVLQLGDFYSGAGDPGSGAPVGLSPCATPNSSSGFCNAGPSQMVLLTAVYVAPSFLDGLVLNRLEYNDQYIRGQLATAAFVTEPFASTSPVNPC